MTGRLRRGGYVLAGAAALATLFSLTPGNDGIRLVTVPLAVVAVLLVVALVGVLGSRSGLPVLWAAAGAVSLLAAALQLAQFGRDTNWLGGNGSTAAFLAAIGIGFGTLWYADGPGRLRTGPDGDA